MADALVALGGGLLIAGLVARAGRRAGLPTIPLFMLAGILLGPHTPGPVVVAHPESLEFVATLGLVLLLFALGLEFHVDDLVRGGARLLGTGALFLVCNVGLGLFLGAVLGWGGGATLVIGGIVGISSSAIVTKLLTELGRLTNRESRLVLGVIVVEDLFLAGYLALLQPVLSGSSGAGDVLLAIGKSVGFLVVLALVARYGGGAVARVVGADDEELLTILFFAWAVVVAGIAAEVGVSDAIGAFMAGLTLAATPAARRIRHLAVPLRDVFAAVFFFSFGVAVEPGDLPSVAVPVLIAVGLTFAGNAAASIVAARAHGFGRVEAANIMFTTVCRGEFALVLAALAAAARLDHRIGPFAAGYVLVLALVGPVCAVFAPRLAHLIPARLVPERPGAEHAPAH